MKKIKSETKTIDITTGWVNLNTTCNNRCVWCYRQSDFEVPAEEMSFEVASRSVDFLADLNVFSCIFIGGEPTLYCDLVDLVERAKARGIKEVTVVSNGRRFSDKSLVSSLVSAGLDCFSVSIHSAFRDLHDKIAGVPSWDETVSGIENVICAGKECSLNLIVGNQNLDSIMDSLPVFLGWGVNQVIVSCAIPHINGERVDGSNALDPGKFAALIEGIADAPDQIVVLHELPLCMIKRKTFLKLTEANRLGYGCHVGIGRGLSIDVDGNVIPCNSFPHHPVVRLFENNKLLYTPEEFLCIWNENEDVVELRREVNVYRSDICRKCDLWEMCNCGCPLTWGWFDPNDYINDGLLGIGAEEVYSWTKKRYNP